MPTSHRNSWMWRTLRVFQLGLLSLVFGGMALASAKKLEPPKPTNEECLACHGDPTMTKDVGGKQISISVNPDAFKASIHGGMFACVDCHTDVKTSPHETTPARISCASCHADQQAAYDRSYHAKAIQAHVSRPPAFLVAEPA